MNSQLDIQKQIDDFKADIAKSKQERLEVTKKFEEFLKNSFDEIKPLVKAVLESNFPFIHHKTKDPYSDGMVIGDNGICIYFYNGNDSIVEINRHNGNSRPISIVDFAAYCNDDVAARVSFALDSIKNAKECITEYENDTALMLRLFKDS